MSQKSAVPLMLGGGKGRTWLACSSAVPLMLGKGRTRHGWRVAARMWPIIREMLLSSLSAEMCVHACPYVYVRVCMCMSVCACNRVPCVYICVCVCMCVCLYVHVVGCSTFEFVARVSEYACEARDTQSVRVHRHRDIGFPIATDGALAEPCQCPPHVRVVEVERSHGCSADVQGLAQGQVRGRPALALGRNILGKTEELIPAVVEEYTNLHGPVTLWSSVKRSKTTTTYSSNTRACINKEKLEPDSSRADVEMREEVNPARGAFHFILNAEHGCGEAPMSFVVETRSIVSERGSFVVKGPCNARRGVAAQSAAFFPRPDSGIVFMLPASADSVSVTQVGGWTKAS